MDRLGRPKRLISLPTILLFTAQLATVITFFLCQSREQLKVAVWASMVLAGIIAGVLAWSTTWTTVIFWRKQIAIFWLFTIFSFCFSTVRGLNLEVKEFLGMEPDEPISRVPISPEALAVPSAMFAATLGLLVTIAIWWLTIQTESAEPDERIGLD